VTAIILINKSRPI